MASDNLVPTLPGPAIPGLSGGVSAKSDVSTPSAAARAFLADCNLTDALMGGTEAMRLSGIRYLPREPAESEAAFRIRSSRSFLFNGFGRTVSTMAGKAFCNPVALGQDVPSPLVVWSANIDLTERDISSFAKDVVSDAIASGMSFILADHPPHVPGSTLADQRIRGDRPYLVHVRAADILGIRAERVGGVESIVRVRIMERASGYSGEWDDDGTIPQIRVLEPGRWETWRQRPDGDRSWFRFDEGVTSLPYVPLFPVYGRRTGFCEGRSLLMDLGWLNLAHWQSDSDYRNILRIVSAGFIFGAGIDQDEMGGKFEIGPNRMLVVSNKDFRLGYVEHTGAGIGALREHLDDLKEDIAVLGAEMLVRNGKVDRTATEAGLDAAESDSTLSAIVGDASSALRAAAGAMADYASLGDPGTWTVSDGFTALASSAEELSALLALRKSGEISRATLYAELVRRGLLGDDFDADDEALRLAAEPPPKQDAGAATQAA